MTERLGRLIKAIPDFLRGRRREMEFLALGVFLAGAGVLASLILSGGDRQGIEIINSNVVPAEAGTHSDRFRVEPPVTESILVDIAGAVIHPGVYRLPPNSRFADALAAAGGLSASADRGWVSRTINLAQNVTDGIKIYIPAVGDSEVGSQSSGSRTPKGSDLSKDLILSAGIINVNSASLTELDTLWGVGEARAKAIIAGRPYGSIDELVARKILPGNVVERNRDRLKL